MRKLVRVNALTAAVGVALFGIALSSPLSAAQQGFNKAPAVAVETSSVGRYIITFAEPGLLRYSGDVPGLSATAPRALGSRKLDANSNAAKSYESYLAAQRVAHITAIESRLGRTLEITNVYGVIKNGIAAALSPSELATVAALPGVTSVKPVRVYSLETFRGPKFIGADKIWDGTDVPGGVGTKGEGIKVGIIDTGTNSAHPSFANDETCGFSAANPKLHAFDCNSSAAGHCNGPNPEAGTVNDEQGHGVHTSSTVAGNIIDNTATPAPALPDGVTMSGVAPCATVYSYKVANASGGLTDAAITAAIESLVVDQIDVANFSIGPTCGGGSPWNDDDRSFLDAIDSDVFVAASAGNTRSNCTNPVGLVSHLGPWMLTVAASTQDQQLGQAQVSVTGPGTPPAALQNLGVTTGDGVPASTAPDLTGYPLRTYPDNIAGCTDTGGFPANYFNGSIALIRRGATPPSTTACTFSEKINNAAAAGATLVLIANNKNDAQGMSTPDTTIAAFKVNDLPTSDALLAFVNANSSTPTDPDVIFADGFDPASPPAGAIADFVVGTSLVAQKGDTLAAFSFRGPTSGNVADLTKPDITGPGVSIYAAGRPDDDNYLVMSGTSMSSPHLAGAAALVRKVHPDWTVAEVKSALMTTTFQGGTQEDGITPWTPDQVGSGRVDLTKAALAGLTLDETYANFVAANPSGGSIDVKDLNLPSVRNANCATSCTWTRTVKNQLATSGSWNASGTGTGFNLTVSPASFTLAPGATQVLTITAAPTGTLSAIAFGQIDLVEASGQSPDQHITAAVEGTGGGGGGGGISQTSDSTPIASNSVACGDSNAGTTADNQYWRRYIFSEYTVPSPANITSVDVSVEQTRGAPNVTVTLYTIPHSVAANTIDTAQLTQIGTATQAAPADATLTTFNVPVTGSVADTSASDLVVEVSTDDESANDQAFYIGSTTSPETHPSFLSSEACSISDPTPTSGIGFPNMHVIEAVNVEN